MQPITSIASPLGIAAPTVAGGVAGQGGLEVAAGSAEISFAAIFEQGNAAGADPALAGKAALPPGKDLPDSGKLAEAAAEALPGETAELAMLRPAADIIASHPVAAMAVMPPQSAHETGGEHAPRAERTPTPAATPSLSKIALADAAPLPISAPDTALKPEQPAIKTPPIPAADPVERAAQAVRFMPFREEQRAPAAEIGPRRAASAGRADTLPTQQTAAISGALTGVFLPAEGAAPAAQLSFANSGLAAAPNGLAVDLPAQQPRDFSALIDRLAASRDAAAPAGGGTLRIALPHTEFGVVAMRFDQSGGNLSIGVSSVDPAFAPAVRAALAGDAAQNDQPRDQPKDQPRDQPKDQQHRPSGQPGDSGAGNPSHGQSRPRGHPEARGSIHSAAPFAQGEGPHAATSSGNNHSARPAGGRGLYI